MDDLSGKINEIFSNPESMEKIRNIIGMLSENDNHSGEQKHEEDHNDSSNMDMPFDPATLMKMKKAFDLMRKDDPRIDFLLALKSNLSEGRRKKVDEAIHLMRLMNLMPLLREQNIF